MRIENIQGQLAQRTAAGRVLLLSQGNETGKYTTPGANQAASKNALQRFVRVSVSVLPGLEGDRLLEKYKHLLTVA